MIFQSAFRIGKLNLLTKSKGSPLLFFTWNIIVIVINIIVVEIIVIIIIARLSCYRCICPVDRVTNSN